MFDVTTVNLEGKDTIRYLSISELPPVLQLQVQRVQFDRKSGKAYKSTAYLKFPETIYMDRYLDSNDPVLEAKREEAWVWKTEIAALEKRKAGLTNTSVSRSLCCDFYAEFLSNDTGRPRSTRSSNGSKKLDQ